MTLSPKFIQGELVRKTQELVGYRLYNFPPPNAFPAVFKSNAFEGSSTPSPRMPYIAIDFLTTLNPFYQEKFEGRFLDENDQEVYGILETKIMQFVIKVYGSGEDDTISIASELSSRLKMNKNRNWFIQFEVGLYGMTNPTPSSIRLNDEYRDVTSFTVSFSYVERYIDNELDNYAIEQVNIDTYNPDNGSVYDLPYPAGLDHFPDDPAPMQVETGDLPQS